MADKRTLLSLAAMSFAIALVSTGTRAQTAAAPPTFDVASIHINNTATDGRHHIINNPSVSAAVEQSPRFCNPVVLWLAEWASHNPQRPEVHASTQWIHKHKPT